MKALISHVLVFFAGGMALLPAAEKSFDPALIGSSYVSPLQLKDWPLRIAPEAQLFVDDYLIHSLTGTVRIPHQPRKYEGNPILEGRRANGTIVFDPEGKKYRMYYDEDGVIRVAFSTDGISWNKPNLGMVSFRGSTDNNVVIGDTYPVNVASFIHDPRDPDPQKRWKAAVFHYDRQENPRRLFPGGLYGTQSGLYAHFSRDGLNWGPDATLIIPGRQGVLAGSRWPLTGTDDVTTVTWDERMGKYVAWLKIWGIKDDGYIRARAMALSDDFTHWSQPWVVMLPDRLDPPGFQIYGMTGWPYASMWLGTIRAFHSTTSQQVNLQLISSRDGIHWERAGNRTDFIPSGPEGSYDHGYHNDFSNPPIRIGDELYFYYGSTPYGKRTMRMPTKMKPGINLARLRVDGFASLHAAESGQPGLVITRPLDFQGRDLFMNAMANNGSIRVAILTGDRENDLQPISGFSFEDSVPLEADGIEQRVTWKGHRNLEALSGKRIRLKIQLNELAALYSFTIR